jgi:diguanylate cyclase (GGDEF)-like protein
MFAHKETNEMDLMAGGEKRAARPKRRRKIMIVDDDADLCRALGLRLRANHYETLSTGDSWNDCHLNAVAAEPNGTVWVGTSGGLSQFKSRPHVPREGPLAVVFTKLVMGQIDVSGQSNPASRTPSNSLTVRYSALNGPRENSVLFRYRLGGSSSIWTETTQRELQFAELAPGTYRLEVEAQDEDGAWNGHKAEFPFRILTPWYRSWWFMGICVLTPVFAVASVVRLRMLSAQRKEREVQHLKAAHDEIHNLAFFDPLTNLPNRRHLLFRLRQTLAASTRCKRKRALLFVDLDNFKTLNDTLGHHTGDLLLQEVARRITGRIRESDTVARLGADEFVVLLNNLSELAEEAAAQAKVIAENLLAVIDEPYLLKGCKCRGSASVGITIFGDPHDSTNEVLRQADLAMYQAKADGRNTIACSLQPGQKETSCRLSRSRRRFTSPSTDPSTVSAAGPETAETASLFASSVPLSQPKWR